MHAIYKYGPITEHHQIIELPLGSKVIRFERVDGQNYMWAIVNTDPDCRKIKYRIGRYQLAVLEKQTIKLPDGSQILKVEDYKGLFYLWSMENSGVHLTTIHHLECYKTGQPIDNYENHEALEYLGLAKLWVMMELGLYFFLRTTKVG